MNDIKYSDYDGFWDKWKMVTVRFRRDTEEERFVYANDAALKALRERGDYPDGAVFGKVGFSVVSDPAFESSTEPKVINRIQLMVRNKEKYKDTDGWGYALFDGSRHTFNEDPKITTVACHACHKLVPDRNFVFSRPVSFLNFKDGYSALPVASTLQYEDVKTTDLPLEIRKRLPNETRMVRAMTGNLRKFLFQGTLDEIRPALIVQAVQSGRPAVLLSEDQKRFSIVWKVEKKKQCRDQDKMNEFKVVQTLHDNEGRDTVRESGFCMPKQNNER